VLNDAEREVGTIYKQICPFTAGKLAALVAKNISQHLIEHFASKKRTTDRWCAGGGQL